MKIFQVDSFTKEIFKGNPAAVCITEEPLSELLMQQVAAEMNLSETAFLNAEDNYEQLRWFTPTTEVNLCGHATLAAAHILYEQNYFTPNQEINFRTKSGHLLVRKNEDERLLMDFPLIAVESGRISERMEQIFGGVESMASSELNDIVELPSVQDVVEVNPSMTLIKKYSRQGVIITAKVDKKAPPHFHQYDFVSRYFVPNVGVDEDPVTGSAHCELAYFWRDKLRKTEFKAYQASKRGGELSLKIVGSRVMILGNAITVFKTEIK